MFDIIGDVHGEYSLLIKLLKKAGYQQDSEGIFFHPHHKAFFLGDFIDKGSEVSKVFFLVKSMIEKGYAQSLMGNHELNFICINTEHQGKFLRKRSKKNLNQIKKSKELTNNLKENINFLSSLPLFFENENLRLVHACWHSPSIAILKKSFPDSTISLDNLKTLYKEKNQEYDALTIALKGLEVDISPKDYLDYGGVKRSKARVNWWEDGLLESVPHEHREIPHNEKYLYQDEKKVFFGHYAKKTNPYIQGPKTLCLDFCSSKFLCLYRDNGESSSIQKENLFYVKKD